MRSLFRSDDSTHILFLLRNAVQVIAMRKIDVSSAYVLLRVKTNNRKSQITLVIYLDRLMDLFRLTALYLRTSLDE